MKTSRKVPSAAVEISTLAKEIGTPMPKQLKDAIMARAKAMTPAQVQAAKVKPVIIQQSARRRLPE